MKRLVYAALALALTACGGASTTKPENLLAANSFDELDGWVPDGSMPFLTRAKAHSGQFSASVNPTSEYAGGYSGTLGKLSGTRLNKLRLHAWVWLPSRDAKASLVTQVTDPASGKVLLYDNIDLVAATSSTFGKWAEVDKELTLPAEVTSNSVFKTYLWRNQSSQPVYMDDLQIERAE